MWYMYCAESKISDILSAIIVCRWYRLAAQTAATVTSKEPRMVKAQSHNESWCILKMDVLYEKAHYSKETRTMILLLSELY